MKNFNPYKLILGVVLLSLFNFSCESDLEVLPQDSQSELDFLNNPGNAIQLVNGVYNKNLDYNTNSFSWIGITSITSDDADKGSTPGDSGADKDKLDALTFNASGLSFLDVWEARYQGIGRANKALFYLGQLSIDTALKNRLIGEVKFLRALWYFDLVRCFGGVPIVVSQVDLNDTETVNRVVFTRRTKEEVYTQIELDLEDAIKKLPVQYQSIDVGRATKGAAQSLLAKSYLYQERWQESFDLCGEVINSLQYDLLDNYADVWREVGENKSESIFEIQATFDNGLKVYSYVQEPRGTPDLGWGFNTPSLSLTNAYEPGDVRKAATIMFIPSTLWDGFVAPNTLNNPRYNYKAYQSKTLEPWNGNRDDTAKNLRVLKYSDILLIRSETAFRLGNSGEALAQINVIRKRAGLADATDVTLESILKERRLEMAMEHDRWFDIVRTGQAQAAMAANGKTFIVGTHEVFPIPQQQITASGGRLTQNNGYN
ncbi:RagB/SusD family nutrient uptake outer membrane protein [Flavobacterium luteum]|uniref:RagB/SusD family nutrient uptake outer membrane protein n=1 Tax=Flavobacterium luteum TaxID=2026654 RepID=A0A7J5AJY7_9FLAO|nr:RagB/SusD family nutrient uptake outer membrane protein [Flavobacterium luteum]KAB1157921.1 RagB/SusD family nutrient uptake outer membrane protein [Flavobacterium luteum]